MAIASILLAAIADRASAETPDISLDWVGIYATFFTGAWAAFF
jgi:hypothetical protein